MVCLHQKYLTHVDSFPAPWSALTFLGMPLMDALSTHTRTHTGDTKDYLLYINTGTCLCQFVLSESWTRGRKSHQTSASLYLKLKTSWLLFSWHCNFRYKLNVKLITVISFLKPSKCKKWMISKCVVSFLAPAEETGINNASWRRWKAVKLQPWTGCKRKELKPETWGLFTFSSSRNRIELQDKPPWRIYISLFQSNSFLYIKHPDLQISKGIYLS